MMIAFQSIVGQVEVSSVTGNSTDFNYDGYFYSLPRTGIKVDIIVNKTQKIKGPYAEFADKYLGLSQVITLNSTEYEVAAIRLSTFTEPDPAQHYFVRYTGKEKDRKPIELFLSAKGILVGVNERNREEEDLKKDRALDEASPGIPEKPNPTMFEKVDTVIRRISIDTSTIEQRMFRKTAAAKTSDQKAKEAADFVLKLEESMFNLINGYQEVNYDKGTMEFMYHQMDKMKNEYLELFKGVKGVNQETYTYTYFPNPEHDGKPVTLCKFSLSRGILEKNSATGDLIQLVIENINNLKEIRGIVDNRNSSFEHHKGIFYRIPEDAVVSVKLGGMKKIESRFPICQLGVVTFLPSGSNGNLEFYDNTGGLKHVIIR
jgi:hypothetical protein